jgi:ribosomal protein S18 acetylase RimI-like enzyme
MAEVKISNEPNARAKDIKLVEEALHRFNFQATRVPYAPQPLNAFLGNREGEIRGGLIGVVQAGWLHIGTLWIHVRYRRRGYGAELMRSAEAEARASGCKYAWLDTFEFQARAFYKRLGYECFGVLNDLRSGTPITSCTSGSVESHVKAVPTPEASFRPTKPSCDSLGTERTSP